MAKCKSCGADIIWIVTPNGKKMPCDNQRIYYKQNVHTGGMTLVLPNGKLDRGDLDLESDKFGYISHFATCPSANLYRKSKENKQLTIADMRGE